MTVRVFLTAFALFLVGCTTPGGRSTHSESDSVELPVSRQATSNERQQGAKVHAELGQLYLQQGSYEVALDEARIALESDASYAPAHNLRGLAYMAIGKNALAEESFRRALSLARNDPEINNDYGWFLCETGRAKDAIELFKVAIGNPLYDDPVRALANAGICSLRYQADHEAESYFLRVIRLDRKHITALYWLADIAYRGSRFADAHMRLRELHVAIEPVAQSAWLALRLARKMGDREEEARMMGIMRRKYRDSSEYQKLSRGEFD